MNLSGTQNSNQYLVWVDLEMTGLNILNDHILEIASIITDPLLNIIAEGPNIIINQSEEVISSIDRSQKVLNDFFENGFIDEVRSSSIDLETAERMTLEFVSTFVDEKKSPMCGNSIYVDRMFIMRYMPTFDTYLHYRNIDVSTIKELAKLWKSDLPLYQKKGTHRALEDIKESIGELQYYRENFIPIDF